MFTALLTPLTLETSEILFVVVDILKTLVVDDATREDMVLVATTPFVSVVNILVFVFEVKTFGNLNRLVITKLVFVALVILVLVAYRLVVKMSVKIEVRARSVVAKKLVVVALLVIVFEAFVVPVKVKLLN